MHHRLIKILSDVRLLNITLPILMVYLIIGTVAQKYIGLYDATQKFFYAPFFTVYSVPLPGMPIFMALLCLNLTCYIFLKNPFKTGKIGTLIAHIGVLLLLIGGGFTGLFSQSGYIDLALGESTSTLSDYHARDFTIRNMKTGDAIPLPLNGITPPPSLPFTLSIRDTCQNCDIVKRGDQNDGFIGMAQHMRLVPKPLDLQNETNMAGVTFTVTDSSQDGTYLVLEGVPQYPEITVDDTSYRFELDKAKRSLPFTIQLVDFRRVSYPGINMAKAYESDVLVTDHDVQWESTISMNSPLRYKGYTFFQSSFIETPVGDRSVLSVVQNKGRAFPYIAGIAICLGLLIHLLVKSPSKKRGKK